MKYVNVSVKINIHAKKIIVGILAHAFVKKASIADDSVIAFDQIISVMDIASKRNNKCNKKLS